MNVIKSLLTDSEKCEPRLHPKEIGVMAPWREQVWKLREQLRKESLNAVDVGTVEVSASTDVGNVSFDISFLDIIKDYQGRESRVVIISCVRSNPRFLEEDVRKGLGFVFERKRYGSLNCYFFSGKKNSFFFV